MANLLQIENYEMLKNDANNNDLMRHLQKQDKVLEEQTQNYLEKIIQQNEIIIKLLEGRETDGRFNK